MYFCIRADRNAPGPDAYIVMTDKPALLDFVKKTVSRRIDAAKQAMDAAQHAANEETKSSAGDKYETGRAMAQNQRDMYRHQFEQARQELTFLGKLSPFAAGDTVSTGTLAETTLGRIFISASLGEVDFEGQKIWVVSPKSPIGQAMLGKKAGESFVFRNKEYLIKSIS